jgi:hypothetical protein
MKRIALLLVSLAMPVMSTWAASGAASGAAGGAAGKTEIKLDIGTPPVAITRHSIAQRQSRLVRFYEVGIIGLANDGLVQLRDGSHLTLVQRQIAEKLIDAENADRNTLIFAIADGNGHREAQAEVRALMVERWKSQFKSGWWIRDADNTWHRKP